MEQLPAQAQAVVIGGGVAGCSVAYHLARLGWTDVVLLERHELTEGTTWHSAGFVGQLRSTVTQTRMIMYSAGLYPELSELTGLDPGWHGVGGLRLATTAERHEELLRQAGAAETYGLDMELLSPDAARAMLPLMEVSDVRAALWLPGDGWLDPARLARALATGAEKLGVRVVTGVEVTGIDTGDGRVSGVRVGARVIRTETVVDAAGAAAGAVGRLAGVDVPIVPIKHQYVVTRPFGVAASTPTVRDPDNIVYFREEGGGILVGGYIRSPEVWDAAAPLAEPRTLFDPDMPKFQESWDAARHRLPDLRDLPPDAAAFAKVVHGPEAFTPDGEFLLGETSVAGLWVAAGFCVHGLAAAGGVGKVMAEWIVDGSPEYDVFGMDIRRFGSHARGSRWSRAKALDSYSKYYDVVYPGEERLAARPLRRSPAWPRHAELGSEFGEKAGWERVNWFAARDGDRDGEEHRPAGWAGRVWSPAIRAECLATRDAAGLFDQTSFAKLEITGLAALRRLCAGDLDRPVGSVVYTQMLNERGGVEADVTVTRLAEDRFRMVTGTAFGVHDAAWLRRHGVEARDVTSAYACYCLWGPKAMDILGGLTGDDLTFGYLRAREITVGYVPVLAQRVTFAGEFGWELYCPSEYGLTLWDTLMAAGLPHGMRPAGYRALDCLRLEKGYRVWGLDVTPETTPLEAGLGFAVRNSGDFLGRAALTAPERSLRCLVLADPRQVCLGGEPVRVDGVPASRVTSGGYGHRVDRSIAYAYLPADGPADGLVEVGVNGGWVTAEIVPEPLYDPGDTRARRLPGA
ncbi:FAD-dependent oxidoreductase [Sphaerisporangium siamense]|uniref:4-methylaminobutanoate oxidase (Formaldehyde-forming) n=1 Tax=Sphaerisporangium siamense TaxID=795645 RepID=A0A7W7D1Y0_9ACTN|nr:FAD-dependent oxidoreductase [Sphaerisporangium siamense]MBB4698819.1 4-methylaminobutanoate oxidase (formaldehyde-forming) [Sphaerisporangium siamense]GII89156.1 FAD-dependent oxidoreductase [Sphaerisporangium siamense]